jgi:xylulose-5-phosphate/fructose-6-phosphate phosphoketolase
MMLCNRTSRFHVAAAAVKGGAKVNSKVAVVEHELVSWLRHEAEVHRKYAFENGEDVEGVYDVPVFE